MVGSLDVLQDFHPRFLVVTQTVQMMYEVIAAELKLAELENSHPQDYLNFYCLGNREPLPNEISSNEPSTNGDMTSVVQKSRRFMIYVHAKGMIVDDEYVIMGSANINERSMSGLCLVQEIRR